MATRDGSAEWRGGLKEGSGDLVVGDGVFQGAYSAASRFEEADGTNPEELIAAAHAACFSMALGGILEKEGHAAERLGTTARVQLRNLDGKPTLAAIELTTEGRVPGADEELFTRAAEQAKADCPVSRALGGVGEISVTARLEP
jgi:lipoyl-dependent peroxiredoxin